MTIDTRPQTQDIMAYAGDTLTIKIIAPASITDGKVWNAHLKATRETDVIDAEFEILPPAVSGDPAFLTLPGHISAALVEGLPVGIVRNLDGTTKSAKRYSGVWDCQISDAGLDPINTLVQGTLSFDQDVTRLP